ncbi:hypothetical protein G7046_g2572 [Stylonectria norvegica]|nr:hypothetical protein G7046_g2572 [Stylonectria norvegica]
MTPETTRARGHSLEANSDSNLLAGLWQEAPFARLPADAPPEMQQHVQDIENPSRIYAIHRASRRHGFQLLVEMYIIQLRNGCGQPNCSTPTCFTCRKRLVAKSPIRKYSTTSARTLAVYLASQDSAEDGLCPNLHPPNEPPAALGSLIFSTRPSPPLSEFKRSSGATSPGLRKDKPSGGLRSKHPAAHPSTRPLRQPGPESSAKGGPTKPQRAAGSAHSIPISDLHVTETPASRDHRSFAANLFGTAAFKMLEWLTPKGVESMSHDVSKLDYGPDQTSMNSSPSQDRPVPKPTGRPPSSTSRIPQSGCQGAPPSAPSAMASKPTRGSERGEESSEEQALVEPSGPPKGARPRHGTKPKPRTTTSSKPKKTMSVEPFPPVTTPEDTKSTILSPRLNAFHHEKAIRPPKTGATITGRGLPEMPAKPSFFENVPPPAQLPIQKATIKQASAEDFHDEGACDKTAKLRSRRRRSEPPLTDQPPKPRMEIPVAWLSNLLPQALSHLDVQLVEFICDVFEEDGTTESQFLGPFIPERSTTHKPSTTTKTLVRQDSNSLRSSKASWKEFNEQSIFNVLSDPQAVSQSFSQNGKLYDSLTLWYCLHRMTQVAPSLVFHSLWVAAGSLFISPRAVSQMRYSPKTKPRRRIVNGLSDVQAGDLMAICMHALVAAAPVVPDSRALYEMSRIRSSGLSLAGGGTAARQPPSRCLEYDDIFSNELALRLAERLFSAITVRRCFADMITSGAGKATSHPVLDILRPLVNQLDFLSNGLAPVIEFSKAERNLHESRVLTVLLDWARAVLLKEWNGHAEFSMDGPFGGALSFIETMRELRRISSPLELSPDKRIDKNRNLLLLGDVQFRVDYLSDRLDSIHMPVEWLSFNSTRWKRHILDYPYIFSPESLVSFFRSINFARMSRMFEESSSLKTRMSAIVDPGSLITNPHHKMVLQDLLRTASSKYLVLDISRQNVARDAFDQLWRREERELLRPLKVHLGEGDGEEGFDSGGVQQEFFRLAIAECLNPNYGAFTVDERTQMVWFTPGSIVEDWKYELVGLLISLAVYNGLTLPITFPKALYRKLLRKPVEELHHIADGWPDLASGLTKLLEWDEQRGLIEDIFTVTYEFSASAFGSNVTREMKTDSLLWPRTAATMPDQTPPGEANPPEAPLVNNDNRDAYVSDYIRYLTDVSVRPQFVAFERGFRACLSDKSLSLLSPPLLQSLVEGVQDIDISELRRHTRYVGWDASHHTVKDFWSIVKRYDDKMKRTLLEFVTSSDRVPVGGMKNLQFVIQKNGEEEGEAGHLPTAYTCYGTLLLPEYRDKDVLRERLGMALENAQGFGFA